MIMKKTRFWVYSGKRPSQSAKLLSECDGFLRLRPGREHKVRPQDHIINWGTTEDISLIMMNAPNCVANASDKLEAFKYFEMSDVSVPDWTDDMHEAESWLEKHTVVCRTKLTGHSGDGIIVVEKGSKELPGAPLYTKYIYKIKEYRVHVCNGKVIDTQRKIRDPDRVPTDWKVRSHQNGFIYIRGDILAEILRDEISISAVAALGLDFGAVDIIEDKNHKLYVLEVNTAPGLEGQTVNSYAEAFRSDS